MRSRVPVSLLNQVADFGINNIQRASRIDPHEVLHLVLKVKKSLTAQLQLRQGLFTLARKKHVGRCIQINRETRPRVAVLQKPSVNPLVGRLVFAIDSVECEVVKEVTVVYNSVAPEAGNSRTALAGTTLLEAN